MNTTIKTFSTRNVYSKHNKNRSKTQSDYNATCRQRRKQYVQDLENKLKVLEKQDLITHRLTQLAINIENYIQIISLKIDNMLLIKETMEQSIYTIKQVYYLFIQIIMNVLLPAEYYQNS